MKLKHKKDNVHFSPEIFVFTSGSINIVLINRNRFVLFIRSLHRQRRRQTFIEKIFVIFIESVIDSIITSKLKRESHKK